MESRKQKCFAAITLLVALAIAVSSAAGDDGNHHHKHHHYKLIDVGTFGGPQSFTQDLLHFQTRRGIVAGWADTQTPDPNYPNSCFFCGPFMFHAFKWRNGVLTDLGALPGVNSSAAFWISDKGWSAGWSENGAIDPLLGTPEMRAVLWKDKEIIDLGTLEGGYESFAFGLNSRGQVTGVSLNLVPDSFSGFGFGTQQRTFLWKDGVMQDLGTLGGPDAGVLGFTGDIEINERGQVAACSYTNSIVNPTTGTPTLDPFLWEDGKMLDLGSLGGTSGCAINLDNRGQVIGYSNLAGDLGLHPFLWSQGVLKDLGTLGGNFGVAISINDANEIVGATTDKNERVLAYLWRHGVMTNLGTLHPLPYSNAQWINSRGQVVGFGASTDFSVHVAFLWENGGPMVDLNTLVPPNSKLLLGQALHINDRGEIAGDGVLPDGDHHAFVLIPCDEDHPGVEDCDYSEVEESASAIRIGSQSVEQNPTTANPWGSAASSSMLRSFGRRPMPLYRNLGVQPPPK